MFDMRMAGFVFSATLAVASASPVWAQSPAMPPQVAKTVKAFMGHWILEGTSLDPGAKAAAKVHVAVDCVPAALARAVACTFAGQIERAGKMEASAVIGYSPDEARVHWMEISSTGEYHNHIGVWDGDTIRFEKLPYTFLGEKFAETLTISFPTPDTFRMRAITDTRDGPSRLEAMARRR